MNRFACIVALALAAMSASAQSLKVGSLAPELKPAAWIKGKPISLKKGGVYVVEFWATWCPPCRESIPHLTKLAKKYKGKVEVIGVSISEAPPNQWKGIENKIQTFVKKMGPKMDYRVAMDGKAGLVAGAWMGASGQQGIPTAFVIGKNGKIAWIGHPMDGLEEALKKATK